MSIKVIVYLDSYQFGSAAKDHLGGLLGRQPESLASSVDDSIGVVLDGFSTVAGDAGGREVLYEAVRYCDDAVVENPAKLFENRESRDVFVEANNRLAGLVGVAKKDKMVEGLKSSAGLSQADAENIEKEAFDMGNQADDDDYGDNDGDEAY